MKRFLLATCAALLPAPAFAQAPGEASAVADTECQRECLIGHLRAHMTALAARDASRLPLSPSLLYTENNVPLAPGQGTWRTVTEVDATGLEVADQTTGHAAWFGSIRENGTAAFYAVRIHVENGLIDEIETVVHRRTGLPAPYGDWANMQHFAEFTEVLPEAERRPRERMLAIADSYFDTVELNDGQVFAPFSEDCSRLENGISTTAPAPGAQASAANIASGCRAQFELGLYKINKRIRRSLPLVDVERGVVVGAGFFDHANEWDTYLLTNGREMRTALKWPNSISLLEAFRIRNGEIQRIEATFTYVPYFMHNLFWGPDSAPPALAPDPAACSNACLTAQANAVTRGMVGNQWQGLNWADTVGYAENSVGIRVGEGIWAGVSAVDEAPLVVADAQTGRAVWFGQIQEHGQPAWGVFTISADGEEIGAVDALIRRREYGAPWADPASLTAAPRLPARRRTARADMQSAAAQFMDALGSRGAAPDIFGEACHWFVNGQDVGLCPASFGSPPLMRVEAVRDRQLLAVDEERGLAVYRFFEDIPAVGTGYPLTYQVVEMYRFDSGRVVKVEAFTSELPYGMRPHGHR